jgi:hypothetical protein
LGSFIAAVRERQVGHVAEANSDFLAVPSESFAGAQPEDRVEPAPVIEPQLDLGEGLGAECGVDSVLVRVGGNLAVTDPADGVLATAGEPRSVIAGQWPD